MRRWMRGSVLGLGAALAVVLTTASTCDAPQTQDRGGQEGAPVDKVSDVEYVEIFRNADTTPNIARICVAGLGFASGTSGRGESGGATPVIRVAEWDTFCAAQGPKS